MIMPSWVAGTLELQLKDMVTNMTIFFYLELNLEKHFGRPIDRLLDRLHHLLSGRGRFLGHLSLKVAHLIIPIASPVSGSINDSLKTLELAIASTKLASLFWSAVSSTRLRKYMHLLLVA